MFNVKWGFVSGAIAFALAFLSSMIFGHVNLPIASIRAGVFAMLFFGVGGGISALVNIFLPELLTPAAPNDVTDSVFSSDLLGTPAAGSHVNITVDDTPNAALPDRSIGQDGANEEVGDFNDLIYGSIKLAKDIDQNPVTGYTTDGGSTDFTPAFSPQKADSLGDFSMDFSAFIPADTASVQTDSFMEQFSSFPESGASGNADNTDTQPERKVSMNKPMELKGDFDPKEIAAGIRTVLEKDKRG